MDNGKFTMITIIHGSDTALARKYFFDQKENAIGSQLINGQSITLTDLIQIFEGGELFATHKKFFIESLIGKRKKSRELDSLIDVINKNSADNDISIWEGKDLTPAVLKQFKNAENKQFKLPQALFTFLDQIKPGNGASLIKLFHQTIETTDPEMVFFMFVRQVRLLLYMKEPGNEPIEEIKRMTWQMSKLKSQASDFDINQLKTLYKRLFEIEKGFKTGTLAINPVQTIDMLLLSI